MQLWQFKKELAKEERKNSNSANAKKLRATIELSEKVHEDIAERRKERQEYRKQYKKLKKLAADAILKEHKPEKTPKRSKSAPVLPNAVQGWLEA